MRILGIDPGTATVGYGLIEYVGNKSQYVEAGVFTTPKNSPAGERLNAISKNLKIFLKKSKPEIVVVETIFFSKNIKTAISVAQARGVILQVLAEGSFTVHECSPQDVKMAVCGYGAAGKEQVQKMVKTLLNLKNVPKPDDAADALAAALSVVGRLKIIQINSKLKHQNAK